MIRLYDTMARDKRPFVPLNKQRITMYVCGPTVYGRAHIGNARPAVVFVSDGEVRLVVERESLEDLIRNDPLVQEMLAQFPSARIVPGSIKPH